MIKVDGVSRRRGGRCPTQQSQFRDHRGPTVPPIPEATYNIGIGWEGVSMDSNTKGTLEK